MADTGAAPGSRPDNLPARPRAARTAWPREDVFVDGDAYYAALLADIAGARSSVELETYIYRDDVLGRRVADALVAAARRGVQVRILVDGFGSPAFAARFGPSLVAAGVAARVYHPLPGLHWLQRSHGAPPLRWLFTQFARINRRNHRKSCVIDGRVAFVGSLNVSDRHLTEVHGARAWRDNGVRVEGPDVARLAYAFDRAWHNAWPLGAPRRHPPRPLPPRGLTGTRGLVRLYLPGRPRRRLARDFWRRLDRARSRIWVTSPYFVPSANLVRALCAAARRGVDVRVLLPRHPDVRLAYATASLFRRPLLRAGVRIFEYMPSVLHAKTVLIDAWASVGSSNLNHRSLLHDLEVDIVVASRAGRLALELQFQRDLEQAEEITFVPWHQRLVEIFLGRVLLLFRHWI